MKLIFFMVKETIIFVSHHSKENQTEQYFVLIMYYLMAMAVIDVLI